MATTTITMTGIARTAAVGNTLVVSTVAQTPCTSSELRCMVGTSLTCKTWKFFYPDCTNKNLYCNASAGAYVPAITVCALNL